MLQAILCLFYGYAVHFYLALLMYLVMIVFNFGFLYWFIRSFYSKYIPEVGTQVKDVENRLVKITPLNQTKYP
jgi:hypothetical protein